MMVISQKSSALPETHQAVDEEHQRKCKRDVDDVTAGQDDRRTAHARRQLQERDHRAGEGQRADGDAERHFDQAGGVNGAGLADIEGLRRIEGAGGDQHRGHADQRVEGGDQFRHRGHRHAAGDHRADGAADRNAENDEGPGEFVGRRMARERRGDRDRHADHAEQVALPRCGGTGKSAQRQDEQHTRHEIQNCCQIGVHLSFPFVSAIPRRTPLTSPSSCTSPACAG